MTDKQYEKYVLLCTYGVAPLKAASLVLAA